MHNGLALYLPNASNIVPSTYRIIDNNDQFLDNGTFSNSDFDLVHQFPWHNSLIVSQLSLIVCNRLSMNVLDSFASNSKREIFCIISK